MESKTGYESSECYFFMRSTKNKTKFLNVLMHSGPNFAANS